MFLRRFNPFTKITPCPKTLNKQKSLAHIFKRNKVYNINKRINVLNNKKLYKGYTNMFSTSNTCKIDHKKKHYQTITFNDLNKWVDLATLEGRIIKITATSNANLLNIVLYHQEQEFDKDYRDALQYNMMVIQSIIYDKMGPGFELAYFDDEWRGKVDEHTNPTIGIYWYKENPYFNN